MGGGGGGRGRCGGGGGYHQFLISIMVLFQTLEMIREMILGTFIFNKRLIEKGRSLT